MTLDEIQKQIAELRTDIVRAHPPEVMNTDEAATFLGVKPDTLFRWRKDGWGPTYSQPTRSVVTAGGGGATTGASEPSAPHAVTAHADAVSSEILRPMPAIRRRSFQVNRCSPQSSSRSQRDRNRASVPPFDTA